MKDGRHLSIFYLVVTVFFVSLNASKIQSFTRRHQNPVTLLGKSLHTETSPKTDYDLILKGCGKGTCLVHMKALIMAYKSGTKAQLCSALSDYMICLYIRMQTCPLKYWKALSIARRAFGDYLSRCKVQLPVRIGIDVPQTVLDELQRKLKESIQRYKIAATPSTTSTNPATSGAALTDTPVAASLKTPIIESLDKKRNHVNNRHIEYDDDEDDDDIEDDDDDYEDDDDDNIRRFRTDIRKLDTDLFNDDKYDDAFDDLEEKMDDKYESEEYEYDDDEEDDDRKEKIKDILEDKYDDINEKYFENDDDDYDDDEDDDDDKRNKIVIKQRRDDRVNYYDGDDYFDDDDDDDDNKRNKFDIKNGGDDRVNYYDDEDDYFDDDDDDNKRNKFVIKNGRDDRVNFYDDEDDHFDDAFERDEDDDFENDDKYDTDVDDDFGDYDDNDDYFENEAKVGKNYIEIERDDYDDKLEERIDDIDDGDYEDDIEDIIEDAYEDDEDDDDNDYEEVVFRVNNTTGKKNSRKFRKQKLPGNIRRAAATQDSVISANGGQVKGGKTSQDIKLNELKDLSIKMHDIPHHMLHLRQDDDDKDNGVSSVTTTPFMIAASIFVTLATVL